VPSLRKLHDVASATESFSCEAVHRLAQEAVEESPGGAMLGKEGLGKELGKRGEGGKGGKDEMDVKEMDVKEMDVKEMEGRLRPRPDAHEAVMSHVDEEAAGRTKRVRLSAAPPLPVTARDTRINLQDLRQGGIEDGNLRRLVPAHKQLRIGIISNLAPLWLPTASRPGQVYWIAGSKCTGFQVVEKTTIHPTITPDLIGPLLDKDPVDVVFYEGWGPSPSNSVWQCPRVKMVVWLQGRSSGHRGADGRDSSGTFGTAT
jgi:hypothetical protein